MATGPPEELKRHATSHTAAALRDYDRALGFDSPARGGRALAAAAAEGGARPAPRRRGGDPHRQRPRAQPEVARRLDPARQVQRHHRRLRLGQVDARLRHPLQRGPAPLPRVAECLRPLDRAAGRPARGRRRLRHSADGGDRAAPVARRPQEHGGDDHRGLALPAPALRQARHPALREGRLAGAAAERRQHRRADPASPRRRTRRRAGAAGGGPKGRLHRPRQVGEGTRPHPPARRRRVHEGRPVAAPRSLQGAHPRAAGGRHRRRRGERGGAARAAGEGARRRQGRDAPARRRSPACAAP